MQDRQPNETLLARSIARQLSESSDKALVIASRDPDFQNGLKDFFADLNNQIAKAPNRQLLIFVHGSCEGQQESLTKAARLSTICGCPVLLFDWASPSVRQAGIWAYIQSDRALEQSELYFGKLIEQIRNQTSPSKITLVAHSMGAKLVRNYLRQYPDCFIDQVHLVRPDISLPVFLLEQDRFQHQVGHMHVYVSDFDLALQSSELLTRGRVERLGRQSDPARWFSRQLSNAPNNTVIIDTSGLGRSADATELKLGIGPDGLESYVSIIGHGIPYEVIGFTHNLETEKTISSFEIEKPYTANPNYWKLKAAN
jgi:esterase/lipase superfamily enzyme